MMILRYLRLCLRRAAKHAPTVTAVTLLLAVCALLLGALLFQSAPGDGAGQRVTVGVVGNAGDTYLGVGIAALQSMDTARFSVEFLQTGEAEAAELLRRGEILGYLRIPDGFVESVVYGENLPLTYVTAGGGGLEDLLMREIAGIASEYVRGAQNAIYAVQDYAAETGHAAALAGKLALLDLRYINAVLGRGNFCSVGTVDVTGGVSLTVYYACGIFLFFLLLCGIGCRPLLCREDTSLSRLLCARGCGAATQYFCEYVSYLCLLCLLLLFLSGAGAVLLLCLPDGLVLPFGAGEILPFFFAALPVVWMCAALHQLLYALCKNTVSAMLIQFVLAVGGGYLSGCFYPAWFFPPAVQHIASTLPIGVALRCLRLSAAGDADAASLAAVLGYTALFLLLGAFLQKRRTERDAG